MQKIKLNKRMLTVGSLGEGRPTSAQACEALRGRLVFPNDLHAREVATRFWLIGAKAMFDVQC
jgi:hypothetical protein